MKSPGLGMAPLKIEGVRWEFDETSQRAQYAQAVANASGGAPYTPIWIEAYNGFYKWYDNEMALAAERAIARRTIIGRLRSWFAEIW